MLVFPQLVYYIGQRYCTIVLLTISIGSNEWTHYAKNTVSCDAGTWRMDLGIWKKILRGDSAMHWVEKILKMPFLEDHN